MEEISFFFNKQKEAKSSKPLFQQIDSDKMLEMKVPSRDVEESEHLPTFFTPSYIPYGVPVMGECAPPTALIKPTSHANTH